MSDNIDKHIDGFRGFLGFYFGENTKLYMDTSGKVFWSIVLSLIVLGSISGITYLAYQVFM